MSFELAGKLIEKFDVHQVSDTFRKREFVIEKTENQGVWNSLTISSSS